MLAESGFSLLVLINQSEVNYLRERCANEEEEEKIQHLTQGMTITSYKLIIKKLC